MKKENVLKLIKDILTKACIYFTCMPLFMAALAALVNKIVVPADTSTDFSLAIYGFVNNPDFLYGTYLVFACTALGAAAAVQVYKIKKLPSASRHILFFVLLYLVLLLIFIPLSPYKLTSVSTLYLSVVFIIIYLIVFGIIMGVKAIINSSKNKKLKYENQFDEVK